MLATLQGDQFSMSGIRQDPHISCICTLPNKLHSIRIYYMASLFNNPSYGHVKYPDSQERLAGILSIQWFYIELTSPSKSLELIQQLV